MSVFSKKLSDALAKATKPVALSMGWPPDCIGPMNQPKRPETLRRNSKDETKK